jgi:pimeloyl-ACP methyl ester carboxylesterase
MSTNYKDYQSPMKPWTSLEPYGRRISVFGGLRNIYLYDAGRKNAQSIVMMHGLGDEADTWRHVILPLSKGFHVIAMDLPGFGRSDSLKEPYTPDILKESILDVIKVLEIENPLLMGSSMGGIFAHSLAIDYPDRFSGLILIGGALAPLKIIGDFSLRLMQLPLIGEWFYTRLRKDPDAAYQSLRSVYFNLELLPKEDRDFLYLRVNQRVWSVKQRKAYFSTLRNTSKWLREQQKNIKQLISKVKIPTLILRGEYDQLFSNESALDIVSNQSHTSYQVIENSGHLPQQEAPQAFLECIDLWLGQNFYTIME